MNEENIEKTFKEIMDVLIKNEHTGYDAFLIANAVIIHLSPRIPYNEEELNAIFKNIVQQILIAKNK